MHAAPNDPHTVARAVLAQRAYQHGAASPQSDSLLELALRWLGDRLAEFFRNIGHAFGHAQGVQTAIGLALLALACAGFALVAFRLGQRWVMLQQPAGAGAPGAFALPGTRLPARILVQTAIAHAAAGRFGEAIATLLRAALVRFDERGVLHLDPARTTRDVERALRATHAEVADAFADLARVFVRAAFAGAVAQRDDFEHAQRAWTAIDRALA